MNVLLPLLLLVAMYALVMRPQRMRMRAHAAMVNSIDVGDEVVAAGGIFGRVLSLDDESMRLEIAPGVEIRVLRRMVMSRVVDEPTYDELDQAGEASENGAPDA
jgi:preprotein translocase subunit YajC